MNTLKSDGEQKPDELWPTLFLEDQVAQNQSSTALIVLNSPLDDEKLFQVLCNHARYRIWADGGANRVHDLLLAKDPNADWKTKLGLALPNAIHGDLDSLTDDVRKRYEELGVEVTCDPDQYSTDFGKSVKKVVKALPNVTNILVLGSLGGRVDQGIGLLHELYREQNHRHPGVRFWLFSESSITVLLRPGKTLLHTPLERGLISRNVGTLPLYGKAVITLKGFEWDVDDWPTEMGGQVSTSNHIMADRISITTDVEILFTVERKSG